MKTVRFRNPESGEALVHIEGEDGDRDLKYGETGSGLLGHAVLRSNGEVRYLRDSDGRVITDDNPERTW